MTDSKPNQEAQTPHTPLNFKRLKYNRMALRSSPGFKFTYSLLGKASIREAIKMVLRIKRVPCDLYGAPLITLKSKEVPDGVFSEDCFGVVYTPKLVSCNREGIVKEKKRFSFSDDLVYKKYPELIQIMPRGFSTLLIFNQDTDELEERFVINGFAKSAGEACDEDSNVDTHLFLDKKKVKNAEKVVITEKLNGKLAVITIFAFRRCLYVFGGSKTEHFVGRLDKGIHSFDELNKNYFAWQILDSFFTIWNALKKSSRKKLVMKLIEKNAKYSGHTVCGEFMDGKHIIPLNEGASRRLVFFGISRNIGSVERNRSNIDFHFDPETFTVEAFLRNRNCLGEVGEESGENQAEVEQCLDRKNPETGAEYSQLFDDVSKDIAFLSDLGLETVKNVELGIDAIQSEKEKMRSELEIEGYVVHYVGGGRTLGLEKIKTWHYIIKRAIRELVMNNRFKEMDLEEKQVELMSRLLYKNREYIKMPIPMIKKWIELGQKFVVYLEAEDIPEYKFGFGSVQQGFGNVWSQFLKDNPSFSDLIEVPKNQPHETKKEQTKHGVLVVFQGIPGLGKSFISEPLISALSKLKVRAVALEQDPFMAQNSSKGGLLCRRKCSEMIQSGEYDAILLMRNNADFVQFKAYATIARNSDWLIHVVTPSSICENFEHLALCLASVCRRDIESGGPEVNVVSTEEKRKTVLDKEGSDGSEETEKEENGKGKSKKKARDGKKDEKNRENLIINGISKENPKKKETSGEVNFRNTNSPGDCTPHPTFGGLDRGTQYAITIAFYAAFRRAKKNAFVNSVSEINWIDFKKLKSNRLAKKAESYLASLVSKARAIKNPMDFSRTKVDAERLEAQLDLGNRDPTAIRSDLNGLVQKVSADIVSFSLNKTKCQNRIVKELDIPYSYLYAQIRVPLPVYAQMLDLVKNSNLELKDIHNTVDDPHVTLVYDNKKKFKWIWKRAIEMRKMRLKLRVVLYGMAWWRESLVAFAARVYDVRSGKNLDSLVFSGYPHVTTLLSDTTMAQESVDVFKALAKKKQKDNNIIFLKLKAPLHFISDVSIIER